MATGLDQTCIEKLKPELSLKRILKDIQTDFIHAPHINVIYSKVGNELWELLCQKLKSGKYETQLPITMEIPKQSGLSRPGAILYPFDRLVYQLIVDNLSLAADRQIDRTQVFSNKLLTSNDEGFMYEPASACFNEFKNKIRTACLDTNNKYVLKTDVANYFERIYQHVLINSLRSSSCDGALVNLLESFLNKLTQKDSHGIVQGLFPSDFLGTFYLNTIDAEHKIMNAPFFRYVDDMYIFFADQKEAIKHKVKLCSLLRRDGLNLNESKTRIYKPQDLIHEETAIEKLFNDAKNEVSSKFDRDDFYNTAVFWDSYEVGTEYDSSELDIHLRATELLFDQYDVSNDARNKIEKFCLAIFSAAQSEYAIDYVIKEYPLKPHMSQVFGKYLKNFISNIDVRKRVESLLYHEYLLFDYQYMWLYAVLSSANKVDEKTVNKALSHLRNMSLSESLRAVCAIVIGKHGNPTQCRMLKNHYENETSPYVRSAVLYSSRHFSAGDRNSCYSAWGGHNGTNSLIVRACKAM